MRDEIHEVFVKAKKPVTDEALVGELCQLDIKDFVQVDGIPCFDINDIDAIEIDEATGKRVKTINAKRLVPIHSELIRLGLLRFVEAKRQLQEPHLFPELSRIRQDGPAQAASNWFQRFRAKVGLTTKQATVFHSFRHGFITSILDAGVSPHMLAPIVGHEADLVTGQVYWNKRDATARLFTHGREHFSSVPRLCTQSLPITVVPVSKRT